MKLEGKRAAASPQVPRSRVIIIWRGNRFFHDSVARQPLDSFDYLPLQKKVTNNHAIVTIIPYDDDTSSYNGGRHCNKDHQNSRTRCYTLF